MSIEARLASLERKLDRVVALLEGKAANRKTMVDLPSLTTKQHATLQMLMRGASNAEIAERFGVTVNTAKVHVRGLFGKFGVHTRSKLLAAVGQAFEDTDDRTYGALSGLPKTWDKRWTAGDPLAHLYRKDGDDGTVD